MQSLHFLYLLDRWHCGVLKGRIIPLTGLGRLVQLVQEFLLEIFMETMLYHLLGLLVLNIIITLRAIPLSTYVIVLGFQLVRKLISGGMTNHYIQRICYFTRGMEDLMCVWIQLDHHLLTQIGMVDFLPGRTVIDVAQCKRDKYMAKCADIGYGFLLFSFSSLGELEADAVTLLKRIRKFSMT
nr:hypothetical protein [Tanacetum cinerariifolium]